MELYPMEMLYQIAVSFLVTVLFLSLFMFLLLKLMEIIIYGTSMLQENTSKAICQKAWQESVTNGMIIIYNMN